MNGSLRLLQATPSRSSSTSEAPRKQLPVRPLMFLRFYMGSPSSLLLAPLSWGNAIAVMHIHVEPQVG